MKRDNWPIGPGGIRPAGPQDRCLYCQSMKGAEHKPECAVRSRTVVVRAIVEYVVSVPEDWTEELILFQRNDGSWCASNGLNEIVQLIQNDDAHDRCACGYIRYEFVREATKEDEEQFGVKVEDIPS